MQRIKTTIYLPDDLRREVKKYLIDRGGTLSSFTEEAWREKLAGEQTRAGKKKLRARRKVDELAAVIKDLEKA